MKLQTQLKRYLAYLQQGASPPVIDQEKKLLYSTRLSLFHSPHQFPLGKSTKTLSSPPFLCYNTLIPTELSGGHHEADIH